MKLTLDPPGLAGAVGSVPLSVRIRERLMSAGHRFHANDNIADYLRDGELDLLQAEVEERLQAVLRALVIDVEQDHNTRETARRVAKMFVREVFAGRYVAAPEVTAFPNVERLNELMVVGPLRVRSAGLSFATDTASLDNLSVSLGKTTATGTLALPSSGESPKSIVVRNVKPLRLLLRMAPVPPTLTKVVKKPSAVM